MFRYDKYVLSQLLVLFGFFALVLVAVFWINRAVVLFDRLIGDGQSAMVFLEFTALGLPNLIRTVLPLSAFAAAVYLTNRLNNESELTVMTATGSSPWRLSRPVIVFGVLTALMLSVLTHFLVPSSLYQLSLREADISRNVTARLLSEGEFLHPTEGVTFYTRKIETDGTLRDVFLSDQRNPERHVTYTAAESFLVRKDDGTNLIMVNGMAQTLSPNEQRLSTANFSDFSYDISTLIKEDIVASRSIRMIMTPSLMMDRKDVLQETTATAGVYAEELHSRFTQPLFCIVAALVGFATLMAGGYSRFGVWREVGIAFALLILLELIRNVVTDPVRDDAELWPLLYVPAAVGLALSAALLWVSAHPSFFVRRRKMEASS
jgi:lipopolysaccharide export system permease protein